MSERKTLDLDALERVARAAGDEPWRVVEYGDGSGENLAIHEGDDWRVCFLSTPGGTPGQMEMIRDWAEFIATFDPPTVLALIDAARAEGGASVDHIPDAGKMVGGDVEELVERLHRSAAWRREHKVGAACGYVGHADLDAAADTLLSLSRLLQERTRERDEAMREASELAMWLFNRYYRDRPDQPAIKLLTTPAGVLTQIDNMVAGVRDLLDAGEARAETAERLLGEVVGALEPFAEAAVHLHPATPDDGVTLDGIEVRHWRRAREALSKVSEEGFSSSRGSVEGPGCVPAANPTHEPSAEGAVSQEGR